MRIGDVVKVRFKRFDRYPSLDLEIEVHETFRTPGVRPRVALRSQGPLDARDALHEEIDSWMRKGHLRPRWRRYGDVDTHETYLRGWGHTLDFMALWVGERTLTQMLEDASSLSFKHQTELWHLRREIAAIRAEVADQNRRFSAAATAFLSGAATVL